MINQALTEKARALGFIATGFSKPRTPIHFDFFLSWLEDVEVGDMTYLKRNVVLRKHPGRLLDGLQTIISLAYPYPATKPSTPDGYAASRYTAPQQEDYHLRLRRLTNQLCALIAEAFPGSRSRVCVDSAPIMERSFAVTSGIGFVGKNTMLIVPGHGSYCFLTEILTTAPFQIPPVMEMESRCGTCTKCVEACPTGALKAPFHIDVSRCLSYLTIEAKHDINEKLAEKMGNTFFGCDVCQEVCPFNKAEDPTIALPSTDHIIQMSEGAFKGTFGKTAFERAGLNKLKGNIRALLNQ
ncbi:MAG: tRNA epoxyqueuosine(34) reductase QueG [Deltaproteobacteria bacterium]|nr:MAG: tRNA epoxyqueuosine(34) reductase QueG [Deltaproteobacteria bacterium]